VSFSFEHSYKQGYARKTIILDRDKFFKLSDYEKIDYQNGLQVKTGNIVENLSLLQGFLYDIINQQDVVDNVLLWMLEQFMKSSLKEMEKKD
tara:strand:+ start:150 stop:425 length:276 start_codon:yes stop_codon:yes gene_type:complete